MSDDGDRRDEALAALLAALGALGLAAVLAKAGLHEEDRKRVLLAIAEPLRDDAEEYLDGDVEDDDFDVPGAMGILAGALAGMGHDGTDPIDLDPDERRELLAVLTDAGAAHLKASGDALVAAAPKGESGKPELAAAAVREWFAAGSRFLGGLYLAASAALVGLRTFAPADSAAMRKALGEQLEYWRAFEQSVADGTQPPNGQVGNRGRMYGAAGWLVGINTGRGAVIRSLAYRLEARMLGVAKHCGTCVAEAALGWQPIDTLRPLGDSECGSLCHCYFIFM